MEPKQTRKAPPEKKQIKKVVHGKVQVKPKSEVKKFADSFFAEDMTRVKSYIWDDVIKPFAKNVMYAIISEGSSMLIFGDRAPRSGVNQNRTPYGSMFNRQVPVTARPVAETRNVYSYNDVVIETRGEAIEVLEYLRDLLTTYGMVSVSDFYESVGKIGEVTDHKYGWTNLDYVDIVRVMGGGYMLKLPRAVPLKI